MDPKKDVITVDPKKDVIIDDPIKEVKKDDMLNFHTKLLFGLGHNPNVGLKTVIYRSWIRMAWGKTVVDTENRDIELECPLSRVLLV